MVALVRLVLRHLLGHLHRRRRLPATEALNQCAEKRLCEGRDLKEGSHSTSCQEELDMK